MTSIDEVVRTKERVEQELLNRPGVTGVDVGYKEVGGKKTDELAIRVLVQQKKPETEVPEGDRIPKEIDGIKTDVIEREYVLHASVPVEEITLQADTNTYDPLKGGISIGPCRVIDGHVYAGTLGCIVRDNQSGNPMLLSNFHVMCVDTGWQVGDTMAQPSRVDTGTCPSSVVGTLQRASLGATVDCAVASHDARGTACEIVDIGAVAGTASATLNMPVRKRGRTTGLTYGTVDSISLSVSIDYGDGLGVRTLTNQIGIAVDTAHSTQIGDHGDSGSVVVDDSRRVVGLYFAGNNAGTHGVANPIADVLTALNVSMCTPQIKIKEHKFEKFEKIEKIEWKEHKREFKEFFPEKITVLEKVHGDKGWFENIPFDPGRPPEQPFEPGQPIGPGPAAEAGGEEAEAGAKPAGEKPIMLEKPDKEVKPEKPEKPEKWEGKDKLEKLEKNEQKEHKLEKLEKPEKIEKLEKHEKPEKFEKPEFKEHKPEKLEKSEKEHKLEKLEKFEKIEKHEKPELKEHKNEKLEKHEKLEKPEKLEKLEKPEKPEKWEHGEKTIGDNLPGPGPVTGPNPGPQQGTFQHFIGQELRPDLSGGALSGEEA